MTEIKNHKFGLIQVFFIIIVLMLFTKLVLSQNLTRITQGELVNNVNVSSGASWGDLNNDGYLDVFIPCAKWHHNLMYINDGNGGFIELTDSPVVTDQADSKGGSWGDYDNDGDLDLFVSNEEAINFLFSNSGDGNFTKITSGIVVLDGENASSHNGSWVDFNNDGYLDIFVSNHRYNKDNIGQANFLYLNNDGDGTFTKIMEGPVVTDLEFSLGGSWADYDNDGDLDLFVANSGPSQGHDDNNSLYQNNGDGTFAKITDGPVVVDGGNSRAGSWGDYNNDGYLDLFVANRITGDDPSGYNFLFANDGNGAFTRVSEGPIGSDIGSSYSSSWGDYDNDGDLDLFVANRLSPNFLYDNNGDGTFTRITSGHVVMDNDDSRGSTWVDYDNDGDLDLFVANYNFIDDNDPQNDGEIDALYENQGNGNSWINLRCVGTVSNTSAIGAKIRLKAQINNVPVWQLREISGQTGGGFCAQNSLNAEFGLGDASVIDSIRIEWPSGIVWDTTNVETNQFLEVFEKPMSVGINKEIGSVPSNFHLEQNYPNPFNLNTTIRFELLKRSEVSLKVYNIYGQLVTTLVDRSERAGHKSITWNGKNLFSKEVSSGVYVYVLVAGNFKDVKRMIILR
jgi:hypothetical protein